MIAVLADTHMPKGDRALPEGCRDRVARSEAVIHAGDLTAASTLELLESLCPVVHAVHGNVDEAGLRRSLPETLELPLGSSIVAVVHDAGPARGRRARLRAHFPAAAAVVFGHSHLPLHEIGPDGFQIFNPGSPTERRRAPRRSMGILTWSGSRPVFEHVWF